MPRLLGKKSLRLAHHKQKKPKANNAPVRPSLTADVQKVLEGKDETSTLLDPSSMQNCEIGQNFKTFDYQPLSCTTDAIRLVNLIPGQPTDPIRCELIHTTLSEKPQYEALSYMWGTECSASPITVNGKDMIIAKNLRQALIHLLTMQSQRLWIDALCINQANILERNHQVRHMGEIYSQAHRVTIWLGPKTKNSSRAMQFLRWVSYVRCDALATRLRIKDDTWSRLPKIAGCESLEDCLLTLEDLSNRQYWRRVWIIQEVVLAPRLNIQCGDDIADWKAVEDLIEELDQMKLEDHTYATRRFHQSLPAQLARFRKGHNSISGCNLAALLEFSERSLCEDYRDKVYSLLGLATDCRKQKILADYSISLYELYRIVIQFFILQGHKTTVIRFSEMLQRSFGGFPNKAQSEQSIAERIETQELNLKDMAEVYGIFRGPIVHLSQPWKGSSPNDQWRSFINFVDLNRFTLREHLLVLAEFLSQIEKVDVQKVYSMPNSPSHAEIFVNPSRKSTMMSLDAPSHASTEGTGHIHIETQSPTPSLPAGLTSPKLATLIHNHLLFVDETGQIGLAPQEAQVGDLVCQFHDCDIAVLVRKQGHRYALAGRILLARRCDEELTRSGNESSLHFKYSVPDPGCWDNFRNEIVFHLDIATMQVLTC